MTLLAIISLNIAIFLAIYFSWCISTICMDLSRHESQSGEIRSLLKLHLTLVSAACLACWGYVFYMVFL
jgi:hypothetical protein